MLCKTVSLWITINLLYILNNFLYSADWHGRCWVPAVCRHRREILVSSDSLGASSLDWAALALVATGTAAVYRALALIQTCHLCCCCHQPWTHIGRELPRNQSSRILCCYTQHRLHLILNLLSLQLECESPCVWAVSRVSPAAVWRSESAWAQHTATQLQCCTTHLGSVSPGQWPHQDHQHCDTGSHPPSLPATSTPPALHLALVMFVSIVYEQWTV